MDKKELQKILSSTYNAENWRRVLTDVFGIKRLHLNPKPIALPSNEKTEEAFELGSFDTADDRLVGVYKIKVKPEVWLERNRVGLRQLLRNIYKYDVDGALIVFVQDQQWRFSYVSQIRTEKGKLETEPKRFTYLFGPEESSRTATERFLNLQGKPIQLQDLYNAFSVEKLNKDFFKTYKEHYEKFWKYLASNISYKNLLADFKHTDTAKQEKPIRDFAKKLLGRIVFLQFLQKKGWMGAPANISEWKGGNKRFVQALFESRINKVNFHSQALKSLFFETLNSRRPNDLAPTSLSKASSEPLRIPYLNGGLFDKDISFDNSIDFPEEYFALLLDFFEQYNFTIDENDPYDSEVGIDPEMLGHIFENLLEENKDKGAFYTPKEIVHYMCQESLTEYLKTHLPEQDHHNIEQLVRNNLMSMAFTKQDKAIIINNLLKSVKICDPAIGSGAFPMGLLKEIFECRRLLYPYLKTLDAFDPAEIKKEIIQENIYGVDLDPGAVDIARLRFWLALVVDETIPQPLPNLDYKIMQGNSLLEQFENIPLSNLQNNKQVVYTLEGANQMNMFGDTVGQQVRFDVLETKLDSLEQHINEYFKTEDQARKKLLKAQINAIIHEHLHFNLDLKKAKQEILLAEAKAKLDSIKFYENDTIAKRKQKEKQKEELDKQAASLEAEIQRLEEVLVQLDTIQETNDRPYFLWHLMFKDVFEKGGFDIVIGNPPYVQLQRDNGALAEQLKGANYLTFERTGDIYALFYELGFHKLKSGGIHTFITSSQWLRANYGKSLRKFFLTKDLMKLINLGPSVFENAVVDTNILVAKNKSNTNALKGIKINYINELNSLTVEKMVQMPLAGEESWAILEPIKQEINKKLEAKGKALKDWDLEIYRGVLTGLNEAFIIDEEKRKELVTLDDNNEDIIRPVLRGREINKYHTNWDGGYIISTFPALEIDIENYPSIKSYLESFLPKIKQTGETFTNSQNELEKTRKKTFNKWFETQDQIGYVEEFSKEKIIWKRIGSQLRFSYLSNEIYSLDSTCIATGEKIKYLTALLNSKLCNYQLFENSPRTGMGDLLISVQALEPLLVYYPKEEEENQIVSLLDKILEAKQSSKNTSDLEHKIDALVFQMYGLSEKEVVHILESLEELGKAQKAEIQGYYRDIQKGTFSI